MCFVAMVAAIYRKKAQGCFRDAGSASHEIPLETCVDAKKVACDGGSRYKCVACVHTEKDDGSSVWGCHM